MDKLLKDFAQSHGIQAQYVSQQGESVDISDEVARAVSREERPEFS